MNTLLLSPYHSGSHKAWATGLQAHSKHSVALATLPGQGWKWRMHGGAIALAAETERLAQEVSFDLVLATDMLDYATYIALTRSVFDNVPFVLYMHENQLLYPLSADKTSGPMRRNWGLRERQYVLINWKSMLAADVIFFNSRFHLNSFFEHLPIFLNHYHDYKGLETVEKLQRKSDVLPCGVDLQRFESVSPSRAKLDAQLASSSPLILWNQRWEFDKNPTLFFEVIQQLAADGIDFQLAICGEHFQSQFDTFKADLAGLESRVVHFGYADEATYRALLWAADLTISTAIHEFFGISIIEAIYCNTMPLLPKRLSYPELIPSSFHTDVFYSGKKELLFRCKELLTEKDRIESIKYSLSVHFKKYDWSQIIGQYDQKLGHIALNHH
ncbi:MAG: DUF3524 domain-containing protein [Chloroflexota bacterium]